MQNDSKESLGILFPLLLPPIQTFSQEKAEPPLSVATIPQDATLFRVRFFLILKMHIRSNILHYITYTFRYNSVYMGATHKYFGLVLQCMFFL